MQPTPHRLTPLLRPRSVALIGASPRPGSVGRVTLDQLRRGSLEALWPVNPRHAEIAGLRCYPDAAALPEAPDLAVLAVPTAALEASLAAVLARGAHAAAIFAGARPPGDEGLQERLAALARAAGVPLLGPNCMGFYNFTDDVTVCGFAASTRVPRGGAVLITHSGSLLSSLVDAEERIGYALAVSAGNEAVTGLADYLDYALAQPETRALALAIETVREPAAFRALLERAREREIPVIALKIGRTAEAARLAISHSGALAGDDAAYEAVFERHGVLRVATQDELAATLQLLTHPRRVCAGGLAAMHDSGGERGILIDLAAEAGVPLMAPTEPTRARLAARLDPGLEPTNPLDVWGSGRDHQAVFADCLEALAEDPGTGLLYFSFGRGESGLLDPSYSAAALAAAARTTKPLCLVTPRHGSGSDPGDAALSAAGLPVIDGEWWALKAAAHGFAWRDFLARPAPRPPSPPPPAVVAFWRARLQRAPAPAEAEALALLADFGLPVVPHARAGSAAEALAAAGRLGYPLALKTAMPGIAHKSDLDGVRLGLGDPAALAAAYAEMAARLGPAVLLAVMAPPGEEAALGLVRDPAFGPLVMLGSGGLDLELEHDRRFLLPPFGPEEAARALARLRLGRRLGARRGRPACDAAALCDAAARLSLLAQALGDLLAELDVNPLRVTPRGCLALDALAVPA